MLSFTQGSFKGFKKSKKIYKLFLKQKFDNN